MTPSKLLLDECFAAEDDRFVDELKKFDSYEFLKAFVEKWVQDPRPWAREQIERYLRSEMNCPGQEVVFKRLFKHFENKGDHEMMSHFLVALDRIVRRTRRTSHFYDWRSRRSWSEEQLFAKPNKSVRDQTNRTATYRDYRGREQTYPLPDIRNRPENRLFSQRTRNYLRRRVWRYFRYLSYSKPMAYLAYVSAALIEFEDGDFASGENILDNWSLMHACYFHHDAIVFTAAHANLVAGRSLAELSPMPYQLPAWRTPKGCLALVELIAEANSTLVRLWAMELLEREHQGAISKLDIRTLIKLLSHVDPRVQEWAIELFQKHKSLTTLRIETWLELLDQSNVTVLTLICDAMRKHVTADRLDSDQMIQLACARPVPVARLGFEMIRERHVHRPFSHQQLARLSAANCQSISAEIATWTLNQIAADTRYDLNGVTEFFDALQQPMRQAAMDWLLRQNSPGYSDPALWARLIETPFDDVKLRLVESLELRLEQPGPLAKNDNSQLWAAVILGVHRGGRTKLKAIRQVADSISDDPRQADRLLPVLSVALRSVRAPERRQALSAIATMAARYPPLRGPISHHLPELQWAGGPREAPA